MDVSYFKSLDNIQLYVYTVLDNFSRKIVAYDVTREHSGRVRMNSLKRAIDKQFGVDLKDVTFSNSIVEGNFLIMKQSYFRKRTILSNTISKVMDFFVEDYNSHRPHFAHEIYTPSEIHLKPELKNVRPGLKSALKDRIASNQNRKCIKPC